MKKIVIAVLCCIVCVSCAYDLSIRTQVIDFSNYSAKGFFLTPASSLEQKYVPLGEVSIQIANYLDYKKSIDLPMLEEIASDKVVHNLAHHFGIAEDNIGIHEYALCKLISKAMNLGGDAIINLNISESYGDNGAGIFRVSGFAIKRE